MTTNHKLGRINDVIRAWDFRPDALDDVFGARVEMYIEGRIMNCGMIKHPKHNTDMFEGYTIKITNASDDDDTRIGTIGYVPFEIVDEWNDRIELIEWSPDLSEFGL